MIHNISDHYVKFYQNPFSSYRSDRRKLKNIFFGLFIKNKESNNSYFMYYIGISLKELKAYFWKSNNKFYQSHFGILFGSLKLINIFIIYMPNLCNSVVAFPKKVIFKKYRSNSKDINTRKYKI